MASQTKVETEESAPPTAVEPAALPTEGVDATAEAAASDVGDDEEVSVDELMISDSADVDSADVDSADVDSADVDSADADRADADRADADRADAAADSVVDEQEAAAAAAAEAADAAAAAAASALELGRAEGAADGMADDGSAVEGEDGEAVEAAVDDATPTNALESPAHAAAVGFATVEPEEDEATHQPPLTAERETIPESIEAKRKDSPLPSFDMPELAAVRARPAASTAPPSSAGRPASAPPPGRPASTPPPARPAPTPVVPRSETPSAFAAPPLTPSVPLSLSEVAEEDDDDAVTHIGLPLPEADEFPEAVGDVPSVFPEVEARDQQSVFPDLPSDDFEVPQGDFQVGAAGLATLGGLRAEPSLSESRRAATVMVPRLTPEQEARATQDTGPGAAASRPAGSAVRLVGRVVKSLRSGTTQPGLRRAAARAWPKLMERYLPFASVLLLGAGLGAVGISLMLGGRAREGAVQQAQAIQALQQAPPSIKAEPPKPTTLVEKARAGELEALFKIDNSPMSQRSTEMALALEEGKRARKQKEFEAFAQSLKTPAGAAAANLVVRFMDYATSSETMIPAFRNLAEWPGTRGPDVLYAVWEKAPADSPAASLARQLLYSSDLRSKATPALSAALELREAKSCEDYSRVLPSVVQHGDQRCTGTMRALKHTDGCGDDGQADCYSCLREGTVLDDALAAIERRPAPEL